MKAMRMLTMVAALAWSTAARPDYLPAPDAAEAALWSSAEVAQARADLAAQSLRSEALRRGSAEWVMTADAGQRRIRTLPRDTVGEWGMALSRPLRLPARAQSDRALADAATAYAEASLGEALHESGRTLLALWFDWLGEASRAGLWEAQHALAAQQLAAVEARVRLGEAARAERVNAEAALAQIRLQRQQAERRLQEARSRLGTRFPALPVPSDAAVLPAPPLPVGSAEAHVEAVLAHNHELARARRHAAVLRAEVQQRDSRRSVDPSLGVFYKHEAGGNERVLGVNLGLTLPSAARRLEAQAAAELSAAAEQAVVRLEQRLRAQAHSDFTTAVARVESWKHATEAATALGRVAARAARAYALGEGSLDQVLQTRRLALEGQLQAQEAQVAALAADAGLRLDAHALWPLDVDEGREHGHP